MATGCDNGRSKSRNAERNRDSEIFPPFVEDFILNFLAKNKEARQLITLKVNEQGRFLRFKNVVRTAEIYQDFTTSRGKKNSNNIKKMKDNFKNTLQLLVKKGLLRNVGDGHDCDKEFLKYNVENDELWYKLSQNYSVSKKSHKRGLDMSNQTSDTGRGTSQSEDQVDNVVDSSFAGCNLNKNVSPEGKFREDAVDESVSQSAEKIITELVTGGDSKVATGCESFSRSLAKLNVNCDEDSMADVFYTEGKALDFSLVMIPNESSVQGGCTFVIRDKNRKVLPEGNYRVTFGSYGSCKAEGFGDAYLDGVDHVPAAGRRGTHEVEIRILDESGAIFGVIPFLYKDDMGDQVFSELASADQGSPPYEDPENEHTQRTKTHPGKTTDNPTSNKKFKSCVVDMPMLVYLCEEMAKRGDRHFFKALINLGIMANVLKNRSKYFNDFAVTARERDHEELAEIIEMYSSEKPRDHSTGALTIGKLLDEVQKERSNSPKVANYYSIYDSNSDDGGYNGDCDSESSVSDSGSDDGSCTNLYGDDCDSECESNIVQSHERSDSLPSVDTSPAGKIFDDFDSGTSSFLSRDTIKESSQDLGTSSTSSKQLQIGLHRSSNNSMELPAETVENDDFFAKEGGPLRTAELFQSSWAVEIHRKSDDDRKLKFIQNQMMIGINSKFLEKSEITMKAFGVRSVCVGVIEDGREVAVKIILVQSEDEATEKEKKTMNLIETLYYLFLASYRRFRGDKPFSVHIVDPCTAREVVHACSIEHLREHGQRIIKEILSGLEYHHPKEILLHGDLKPSNVQVDIEGRMKLVDFGIRVLNDEETTVETDFKGTYGWIIPEIIECINKNKKRLFKTKSDIHDAGMIAFYIATKGEQMRSSDRMRNTWEGNHLRIEKLRCLEARSDNSKEPPAETVENDDCWTSGEPPGAFEKELVGKLKKRKGFVPDSGSDNDPCTNLNKDDCHSEEEMAPTELGTNVLEQSESRTNLLYSDDTSTAGNTLDDFDSGTSSFLSRDTIKESSQDLDASSTSLKQPHTVETYLCLTDAKELWQSALSMIKLCQIMSWKLFVDCKPSHYQFRHTSLEFNRNAAYQNPFPEMEKKMEIEIETNTNGVELLINECTNHEL